MKSSTFRTDLLWALAALVLLALLPALTSSRVLLDYVIRLAAMGIFATSLNILIGYGGLVSFGHAMFFGGGAYAFALMMQKTGASIPLAMLVAILFCAVLGLVVGAICVRLKEIYFSFITLAFQMLLYPYICPETETESRKRMDGPLLTKAAIDWFVKCLAAEGHPQIDRVILGSKVDVSATPAAYVVTAGYDPLQDEGRDYARRLEAAGVPVRHVHYPDMLHDFYIMGDVSPAVGVAAREAAEAMKAALNA